ncbi:MAG TPA: branched-chain amino acid ABC transporter permease [Stellaceae bacterium]|jgi:branched-chain amino acid transport system permease protein|nr:branched-chain amino acid ABC transporter permease [Stellaceae bacterium]
MIAHWRLPALLALGLAVLIVLPVVAGKYDLDLAAKIMIMAIFAMSLDLLVGIAGMVSLGHAAFFGVGAYALYLLSPGYGAASLFVSLPAAVGAAAVAALIIGLLVLRSSGVYFIMVTLAFGEMFYYYATGAHWLGGSDGAYIYQRPHTGLIDLGRGHAFYYLVLIALAATYVFLTVIVRAPFGHALRGIRGNEHRMRSLGFATARYKLLAFVIAGALAGLAGYLDAAQFGVVNPELFSWRLSGEVLMMVILGGMGSLHGAILGAIVLVLLENFLGDLTTHWLLPMGLFIIGAVLLLPRGLADPAAIWRAFRERRHA